MEQLNLSGKLHILIQKYKYALIILVIGLVLMMLPAPQSQNPTATEESVVAEETEKLEDRLEMLLSQIEGAGQVRVLLTLESGEEIIYQTDSDASADQQSSDTVIIEDSENAETGLVRYVRSEIYRGAVVVCSGAESPVVRLAIIEAVSCATGLRSDQISVVK